jgi:hypothetical protein
MFLESPARAGGVTPTDVIRFDGVRGAATEYRLSRPIGDHFAGTATAEQFASGADSAPAA